MATNPEQSQDARKEIQRPPAARGPKEAKAQREKKSYLGTHRHLGRENLGRAESEAQEDPSPPH